MKSIKEENEEDNSYAAKVNCLCEFFFIAKVTANNFKCPLFVEIHRIQSLIIMFVKIIIITLQKLS